MPFEWAFLMDALQAERDQNVTIDTARIWFSTAARRYCLIDAPGHQEFIRNMLTGAASASAALLLIDAEEGMKEQSRRHASLLAWLGIDQVIVLINKMDLADYQQARFEELVAECNSYLARLHITSQRYIPISAREGDNIAAPSARMPWYDGPPVLAAIDAFTAPTPRDAKPLRIAVQDVYRFDARRIIAGRVESGTVKVGDTLLFSPSNMSARVKSFEHWPEDQPAPASASAGESVGFVLDEQIFVERGQVASHPDHPPLLTNRIPARVFWLSHSRLEEGASYRLKLGTAEYQADIQKIEGVYSNETLEAKPAHAINRYEAADVMLRIKGMAVCDDFREHPASGRFVLFDGYDVAGGGVIHGDQLIDLRPGCHKTVKSQFIVGEDYGITPEARAAHNGHRGGILWFTGLSGSGKSTLARELQKRLFLKGYQVNVLDGDNIRRGLCSDLGFSPEDRTENIRRVGEVAALFAQSGMIVITALISPYAEDRRRVRAMAPEYFNTVYINADIAVCEQRDSKGLYQKARAGEIQEFTGVSAPYEAPEQPDLVVDTTTQDIATCTDQLYRYIERVFVRSLWQDRESYVI